MCFSESLATTCMSLRNKLCVARPTLIDSNLIGLNYYPFIVILDKCNAISDIARKICFPSKTKNVNVKEFNTMTRTVKAKMLVNVNVIPIVQQLTPIKNGIRMSMWM